VSIRFHIPITLGSLGRGFHVVPDEEIERESAEPPPPIDYAPLVDASRQAASWLLDIARSRATDPLDLTAIDRVQRAMSAMNANTPPCARPDVSEEDLVTVAAILIDAFASDLRRPDLGELAGSHYDASDAGPVEIADGPLSCIHELAAAIAHAVSAGVALGGAGSRDRVPVPIVVRRRRPRLAVDLLDHPFTLR
jgi:hypothetical protein